jgi:hypothetical protein
VTNVTANTDASKVTTNATFDLLAVNDGSGLTKLTTMVLVAE